MNLHSLLQQRAEQDRPIRVGLIGAGKFGAMFLAQARRTPGLHVLGIADLAPDRARDTLQRVGWPAEQYSATGFEAALRSGATTIVENGEALIAETALDVVIDATGSPAAGIRHALSAVANGKHMVMVNVEADALAGPLLAERARAAGLVYSLAYGDQPALICEMVDWARASGFGVVCAGKGTKHQPEFHASTPETVWGHYGLSPEAAAAGGMNPKMFNSFLDGTKSGIEMAAVSNATGLTPPVNGLAFPPCGVDALPGVLRPSAAGGILSGAGMVEVVSCVEPSGGPVERDLRWGVYAVFEAPDDYVARCFAEYGLKTDTSGRYAAMYKPFHLIGLELGISVASAGLRGEPTGAPTGWRGDVLATAKRDLNAGEILDGEGGYTVWGTLTTASQSLALGGLPIGLADGCRLKNPVPAGEMVRRTDVDLDDNAELVRVRREMEQAFGEAPRAAVAE
ncbi:MAG: SAF domain-containing protein [Alphaproteobacteria bacterium]|nr:SAF domain-containing protein [Alphaproteobacteria bacterium]